MICFSCKQEVDEGTIFCRFCGTNLNMKSELDKQINKMKNDLKASSEGTSLLEAKISSKEAEIRKAKKSKFVMAGISIILVAIMIFSWVKTGEAVSDANYYEDKYYSFNNEKNNIQSEYESQIEVLKNEANNYQTEIESLTEEVNNYQTEIETLKNQQNEKNKQLANLEQKVYDILPNGVKVQVKKVYNGGGGLTDLGSYLETSTIKFLTFDLEIITAKDISNYYNKDIKISIYEPDGSLSQGTDSPSDCSFIRQIDSQYISTGWGSATGGTYYAGWHIIVFTYDGVEVGRDAVYIN